jgi:hypothetical protein
VDKKSASAADANICLLSLIAFVLLMKIGVLRGAYSLADGVRRHKSGIKPAKEWGGSFS